MYTLQVVACAFQPGPRSKYDAARLTEQAKCGHPYEQLKWGANKSSVYASCTGCGVRTIILHHRVKKEETAAAPEAGGTPDNQSFMTMKVDEEVKSVHAVHLRPGLAMVDTGCRRAVGGHQWHKALQQQLGRQLWNILCTRSLQGVFSVWTWRSIYFRDSLGVASLPGWEQLRTANRRS